MKFSLYQNLGVDAAASAEEITAAHHQALARLAPAAQRGEQEGVRRTRMFKAGYYILSHPGRRARYDRSLEAGEFGTTHRFAGYDQTRLKRQRWSFARLIVLVAAAGATFAGILIADKAIDTHIEYREAVSKEWAKKLKPNVIEYKVITAPAPGGMPQL